MTPRIEEYVRTIAELMNTPLPIGASWPQIEQAEKTFGIPFPPQLKEWLHFCNGTRELLPAGYYGIDKAEGDWAIDALYHSQKRRPEYSVLKWFPICDDGCGDDWVMPLQGERHPILFVDHEQGYDQARYVCGSDLDHFLEMILEQEIVHRRDFDWSDRWPGDEEFVRARDPNIGEYNGVYPLWEADRRRRESRG